MKYKVSLLPEKNRKRIIGKKKAEKVKVLSLVALVMMLSVIIIVLGGKLVADKELREIKAKNAEYEQKVQGLQQYREINDSLQNKIQLIKNIQVKEPSLYNFLASISNVNHTDVSVTTIECTEWKTARLCTLVGTCQSRQAFLEYIEKLEAIEGVENVVCTAYTVTYTAEGKAEAQFTITINCSGGSAIIETTEATEATAEGDTTAADESAEE